MWDPGFENLVHILPILAKTTGGYAAIADLNGSLVMALDADGKAVSELEGDIHELASNAGRLGYPQIGVSKLCEGANAWALPIGNYVLISSNAERVKRDHHLKESLLRALPMIAQVAGGEAVLFDSVGERIISFNSDGTERKQFKGKVSGQAKVAIEKQEPVVGKSFSINGAMAVRIPITKEFGFGFNNQDITRQQQILYEEVKRLQHTNYTFDDIIGESQELMKTKSMAKFVANGVSTILIYGETGTGKELFAQSIHNSSERLSKPFVALNCGALPGSLIESNLFGYEEGSFTGAKKGGSPGTFEQANNGTIFLDEISEMEIGLQTKLLRVLQEREVVRIGGFKPIKVNVRVIASTNKDLNSMIAEGKFRRDLFYRLNVVQIKVPALRERPSDMELLARHFLQKYNTLLGKYIEEIDLETLKILKQHTWPGNVRELQNCIESAMNMVEQEESRLMPRHLPIYLRHSPENVKESVFVEIGSKGVNLKEALAETEKVIIQKALEMARYKRTKAASLLGISSPTLWRKMTEYGLDKE
ncbi:MAG: sigma 54-interacting transcriptional regulator [Bacillota bacterium]|nr:sigma 54-interacting transcriptional regulator [Bacillota bacterium]